MAALTTQGVVPETDTHKDSSPTLKGTFPKAAVWSAGSGISLEEYPSFDGLGLAELVRSGKVSWKEVVEPTQKAIDAVNPALNTQSSAESSRRNL